MRRCASSYRLRPYCWCGRHAIVFEVVAVTQPLRLHERQQVLAEVYRASKRRCPQSGSQRRGRPGCWSGRNQQRRSSRVRDDRFARRSDSGQRRALPKHARGVPMHRDGAACSNAKSEQIWAPSAIAQCRASGCRGRHDRFRLPAASRRAIALATKDSSGSDRVGTVADDRIRPEGAFAAAGIRQSVSTVWTLAAVAASGIVPGAKRSSPLPTLAAAPLSLTDGARRRRPTAEKPPLPL